MGIKGLLPLLSPIARPVRLDRYRGLTAAVDAMAWLHRGIYAGDVRTLAHLQHAARYRAEAEAEAEAEAAGRDENGAGGGAGGGGGGDENGDAGRYRRRRRRQDDDDDGGGAGDAAVADAADAEEEEEEAGPSRRIDFDRAAAEPAAAARPGHRRAGSRQAAAAAPPPPPPPPPTLIGITPAQAARATDAVLAYALGQSRALLARYGLASVLLVLDGDSLPSKARTDAARSERRYGHYREAREAEGRGEGGRAVRRLYARSCGITHEMRRGLVERVRGEQQRQMHMQMQRQPMQKRGGDGGGGGRGGGGGDDDDDGAGNRTCGGGTVDYLVAPYEADAQMAQLAHAGIVDVVIAEDSDLLAYGCPRVVFKVDVAGGRGQEVQLLRDLASMGAGRGGRGNDLAIAAGGPAAAAAPAAGGGGGNASSLLSFQNWTHDMFVYMCILSGCDYCDGVPGVGIKTAHKLVRMYRTPARIFRALRAAGRMPGPTERGVAAVRRRDGTAACTARSSTTATAISFEESFWTAYRTFRHQTVYNPATGRAEPLLPIVEVSSAAAPDWDAVGPMLGDEMARDIATGRVHPVQRIPWEAVLAAARAAAARTRIGEGLLSATAAADQPIASRSRHQLLGDAVNCSSPHSTGRARRALANPKDLFRFFARKPKGSGSSGGSDDLSRASPSSRSGRNRPPLREIFVNTNGSNVGNNGLKKGNLLRPVAASVTNLREKSPRAGGGGHQPIPIHFRDYSSSLVGTTFQPLSRQNNRADTSATRGLASHNISRAVQCLKVNAAKARAIKYRGRRSPKGSKDSGMGMAGSEHPEGGDMLSLRLVPEASSQSVQSAPEDLLVRVHRDCNETTHDQVYGRSSLDAHRNYDCNHYLSGEDASQYHSRAELDRGFVDESAFEVGGILLHNETDQYYDNYPKEEKCGGYDQQLLEHCWSEGLEYEGGADYGIAHRKGTARVEQVELPVDSQYQDHFKDQKTQVTRGKKQRKAFGEDWEGDSRARRESSLNVAIDSNYQQLVHEQYDHFHDEELLLSNNFQDDIDQGWQQLGDSEGVKVPGSELVDASHQDASEYPPLDLSISSPQLKRQNRNATPDFRNSGVCAIQDQHDQDGKFDHQFPLEDDSRSVGAIHQFLDATTPHYNNNVRDDEGRAPADQEVLQGICAEQLYDGTIDYGTSFSVEGNYYYE